MVDSILDALTAEVVGDVAAARRLDPDAVRRAIDGAPLAAETAASAGLVDTVCYDDELPTRLGAPGRPAALLSWEQARRRLPVSYRWSARTSVIGVIDLAGAIVTGESRESPVPLPLLGRRFAGSDTVARAFRAAERSPGIRAVVFHVDSGGGSALASDLIWREVEWVRRTKPVVVFMSNVAGQLTARGLFDRLGLAREIVARGRAATMDSAFEPLSEELLARVRGSMQAIYRRFVGAVATGRGKSRDEIETVARGRI
jgi:protease-4